MAKIKRREIEETRKVLYGIVNEIELEYGVQILQCNEKFDALATDIVETTRKLSYAQYISELYYRVVQLKETITAEIAAIKNKNIPQSNYVLAINA